jgi:hypothetical protein
MYFGLALNSCYQNCVVIKNPVMNWFFCKIVFNMFSIEEYEALEKASYMLL